MTSGSLSEAILGKTVLETVSNLCVCHVSECSKNTPLPKVYVGIGTHLDGWDRLDMGDEIIDSPSIVNAVVKPVEFGRLDLLEGLSRNSLMHTGVLAGALSFFKHLMVWLCPNAWLPCNWRAVYCAEKKNFQTGT